MNFAEIKDTISKIEHNILANKICDEVVLVAATKTRDIETIELAVKAGLSVAGENRVQEFLSKYKPIEGLTWHFIGALQTNKVKYIVDKVDMIHSVDRIELAIEINRRCQKLGKVMPILIEVNVGAEVSKSGIDPNFLFDFVAQIKDLPFVKIVGLMTVLPKFAPKDMYEKMYSLFNETKNRFVDLPIKWLSMGMSGDYEMALKCGANMIRLGTVLFGERVYLQ